MKVVVLVLTGAALGSCAQEAISTAEANQLVTTILERDAQWTERDRERICVQSELEPPLLLTRQRQMFPKQNDEDWREYRSSKRLDATLARRLDDALKDALKDQAAIAPISEIASAPVPLVLFTEATADQDRCNTDKYESSVISLTRPVIARQFAFVEHAAVCGAMCGAGTLDAFEMKNGKWTPVASGGFWYS